MCDKDSDNLYCIII